MQLGRLAGIQQWWVVLLWITNIISRSCTLLSKNKWLTSAARWFLQLFMQGFAAKRSPVYKAVFMLSWNWQADKQRPICCWHLSSEDRAWLQWQQAQTLARGTIRSATHAFAWHLVDTEKKQLCSALALICQLTRSQKSAPVSAATVKESIGA